MRPSEDMVQQDPEVLSEPESQDSAAGHERMDLGDGSCDDDDDGDDDDDDGDADADDDDDDDDHDAEDDDVVFNG